MAGRKKLIQDKVNLVVPMERGLKEKLNNLAHNKGEPTSHFIREVLKKLVEIST